MSVLCAHALHTVCSPDGRLEIAFFLANGEPRLNVLRDEKWLVAGSKLGLQFRCGTPLESGFACAGTERRSCNAMAADGKQAHTEDKYNEIVVRMVQDGTANILNVRIRACDDGFCFRYEVRKCGDVGDLVIVDELTQFGLSPNDEAWLVDAEVGFNSPVNEGEPLELQGEKKRVGELIRAQTPLIIQLHDGRYLSIGDVGTECRQRMILTHHGNDTLKVMVEPCGDGVSSTTMRSFLSPWRAVLVADEPAALALSAQRVNRCSSNELAGHSKDREFHRCRDCVWGSKAWIARRGLS